MRLNFMQRRFVSLATLCLASFVAAACHSAQRAEERRTSEAQAHATAQTAAKADAQPTTQPTIQPTTQVAQTGATGLKKGNLTYADRVAWRKALNLPNDCENVFDKESDEVKEASGLRFFTLAQRKYLVEAICQRGGYEGNEYRYALYDESQTPPASQLLTFKNYIAPDDKFESLTPEETSEMAGVPKFNSNTKELTILRRFSATGDCGAWARYGFEQWRSQLREFRARTACDGKFVGDPRRWRKVDLTARNSPNSR